MKKKYKTNVVSQLKNVVKSTQCMLGVLRHTKYGKPYILCKLFSSFLEMISTLIATIMPGLLIGELFSQEKDMKKICIIALVMLCSPLLFQLIRNYIWKLTEVTRIRIAESIDCGFFKYLSEVDSEKRENPEIESMSFRVKDTLDEIIYLSDHFFSFFSACISLITILSLIATINPGVLLVIISVVSTNAYISKSAYKKQYETRIEANKLDRFSFSYVNILQQYIYMYEMKMFGLTDFILNKKKKVDDNLNQIKIRNSDEQRKVNLLLSVTSFFQQAVLYLYLIFEILRSGLTVGTFTIYLSAANQFSDALGKIFNAYVEISKYSLSINELQEFFNMQLRSKTSGDLEPFFDENSVIEFENVRFRYPSATCDACNNLNLTIRGNEKLCIVGANGSGKSTFIKLLTRLYAPTEGHIRLNGIDIEKYDYKKYQKLFATVFQKFELLRGVVLKENIALNEQIDEEKLQRVSFECGLPEIIKRYPHQFDTYIDKWVVEDGVNPSGGESQRIAIARACYRDGDIFLLDEPTAALDPVAEHEIYTQFNNIITDKCAIFITHRLSAVQLADKVAVFDNGHVAEYGTHAELYAKGGIYTEMFDKQAQFYRDAPQEADSKTTE